MTQASWDSATALNPVFTPSSPSPPPPSTLPYALLLIPQGLGAFTFQSFQPQRTISPRLFIGEARSSGLLSLLRRVSASAPSWRKTGGRTSGKGIKRCCNYAAFLSLMRIQFRWVLRFVSSSLSLVHEFRFLITAGLIGSRGAVLMWLDAWFKWLFCKTVILIRAFYLYAYFFSRRASMVRIPIATRVQNLNQNELNWVSVASQSDFITSHGAFHSISHVLVGLLDDHVSDLELVCLCGQCVTVQLQIRLWENLRIDCNESGSALISLWG